MSCRSKGCGAAPDLALNWKAGHVGAGPPARHMAQLLGRRHIEECYESSGTLGDNAQPLPQWTRDWRACGPLMTEYGLGLPGSRVRLRMLEQQPFQRV